MVETLVEADTESDEIETAFETSTREMEDRRERVEAACRRMARSAGIQMQQVMLQDDVSVAEMANRLQVSKGRIRRILLGEQWRMYRDLCALAVALDVEIEITITTRAPSSSR